MEARQLYQWIKENREMILADKLAGNSSADNIVTLYNMLVNYPDSAALGLLQAAVQEYKQAKKEEGKDE